MHGTVVVSVCPFVLSDDDLHNGLLRRATSGRRDMENWSETKGTHFWVKMRQVYLLVSCEHRRD